MRPQLIITLLICLACTAGAETTNLPVRLITLKECINLALDHNLDLKVKRLSTDIARYRAKAGYGAYDPVLSLHWDRTFIDQPAQFDPKKSTPDNPYELTVDSFGPGLSGFLPWGMTYNLSAQGQHLDANRLALPAFLNPLTNDYTANLAVTVRQPLLKNFWIDPQRRDIQLSKADLKISEAMLRAELMTNVAEVQIAYYDLILNRELVKVERKAVELARQLLDAAHKKVEAGQDAPLNEKQAESHIETVRTALFAAEQDLAAQENTLKLKFSDDFRSWVDVRLEPAETLLPVEQPIDRQDSWLKAMANRPDLVETRLKLEKDGIIVRFEKNQRWPSLDVVGGFGWQAVNGGFGTALDQAVRGNHSFYSVGATLSIPLIGIAGRNNVRAAEATRQQDVLRLKKMEDFIIAEVDTKLKEISSLFQRVGSTRTARTYAEQALEAEMKMMAVGAATSFNVERHQRDLVNAQSAELKAIADYYKALAKLSLQEGTTLQKHQIEVRVK